MPAGRPSKPIELKRATGNPGQRPLPDKHKTVALMPADGVPPVPKWLEDHGKAAWLRIWQSPARRWLSPEIDMHTIETVCYLTDEIAGHRSDIRRLGRLVEEDVVSNTGRIVTTKVVTNPAIKSLRDAEARLAQELSSLGFNPTARAKLGLAEVKVQSKLQELREGSSAPILDADIIDDEVAN